MYCKRVGIFSFLFLCLYLSVFSQPFACDGRLILSTLTTHTTNNSINFGSFGLIYYSQNTVFLGERFDALGFNTRDNYIYGVRENTNSIVRLRVDGTYEVIGSIPQVDTLKVYAGDCSSEGLYLYHDDELDKIFFYSVVNDFELVNELDLFWDPSSPNSGAFTTRIDDFVIDPNNSKVAYTYQGHFMEPDFEPAATRGYLLKINLDFSDPNVGMVTPIAKIPSSLILQMGSMFYTKEGRLFGLGPYQTEPFIANRLIAINPSTGDANMQGTGDGPLGDVTDGCSCPFSLTFENDIVPRAVNCNNSTINFNLTITNGSNLALSGVTFRDTLPEKMVIEQVVGSYIGNIAEGTGVGTGLLAINNLQIGPRETVTISIKANVIDIPRGLVYNQAHLTDLPVLLGGERSSDEPTSDDFEGDVSGFFSAPIQLETVKLQVVSPSDCLSANDGQVFVSSPLLNIGERYLVKLINQSWEELYYDVLINNENTFLIDSLLPGEYKLKEVTPQDSKCGFIWDEQTIVVAPPNELLQASVTTNSPICEGADLELNGTIFPDGAVAWTGPERFVSSELNPRIDLASNANTGMYEMVATYGFCEQVRPMEVLVTPPIEASITGKTAFCEREPVALMAAGNGDLRDFKWSGPANFESDSQQMMIFAMTPNNEGIYQVIIDNGYCTDTTSTTISQLRSPTIHLPEIIETDFCAPVKLSPILTGDDAVTYSWTKTEGLSCYDCPTPELLVPSFLPIYRLDVINDLLCTDTAKIQIALAKDKLIYVPNAFSPNFDGINDYFQMFPNCGVSNLKNLEVVNRWGSIVYAKKDMDQHNPQAFWDGRINGEKAASGVYIWQVQAELVDGTELWLFGDITLLR